LAYLGGTLSPNMKTDQLPFFKCSGAGNTFVIFDLRNPFAQKTFRKWFGTKKPDLTSRLAASICDSQFGIGADGTLVISSAKSRSDQMKFDVEWSFFNRDGSRAEMCGNAARCVGRVLQADFPYGFRLKTKAGVVRISFADSKNVHVGDQDVVVAMTAVDSVRPLKIPKGFKGGLFVDSGVPHAVIETQKPLVFSNGQVPERSRNELAKCAATIREHREFKKSGVNVTFVSASKKHRANRKGKTANVRSLTFERGVDGYTQACGTGAVAAAYYWVHQFPNTELVKATVPGGLLCVDFSKNTPILSGPATIVSQVLPVEK
jgi:diaminopimelate epimerase